MNKALSLAKSQKSVDFLKAFIRNCFSKAYKLLRPSIIVYTEVTTDCNNKCFFCAHQRVNRSGFISGRVKDSVVELISSQPQTKFLVYFHLVGEPLIYEGLEDYIKRLSLPNVELWVCTNGKFLTSERLNKLHKAGLRNVWFSYFYADKDDYKKYIQVDSFPEVKDNLYNLLSNNILFNRIKIVTFSKSCKELENKITGKRNVILQRERNIKPWIWNGLAFNKYICVSINGDVCFDWKDYNFESSIGKIYDLEPSSIIKRYKSF